MNINSAKDDDYSSIDPSIMKDFIKSEESDERTFNKNNRESELEDEEFNSQGELLEELEIENEVDEEENQDENQEENREENQDENQDENQEENQEENQDEIEDSFNEKFTGEVISIDEEEINDQFSSDNIPISPNQEKEEIIFSNKNINQSIPKKTKTKDKVTQEPMERISEAEFEDDKHNTIFDKINNEILKDEYRLNEENFDEIMKQNLNSKNVKDLFNPTLYNTENDRSYKFKPEINKTSRILAEENRNKSQDSINNTHGSKIPIELELYKDAVKRKEKLQKIEYNNMMAIVLNASKTKISNNSHKISINKVEKMIDSSIEKYAKNKKLTFIEVGQVLTELKIFREIFPDKKEKSKNIKNIHSYKDIKYELNHVKEIERRKKQEVDFYEQLWLTLNPDNKDFLKSDILSEFLKILFSPVAQSVKEISSILKQFLLAAFFLNSNPDEHSIYISPITDKKITEEEIWPLDKTVKEFLQLKENILAYQQIHNASKKLIEDLEKIKKDKMTFAPEINKDKNEKFQSRSNFWEERLTALLDRDKLRRQVLEEMKKENDETVLKECTFKPQINKKSHHIQHDESFNSNSKPVYDKLYSTHKENQLKRQKEIEVRKNIDANRELDGCTFKPNFVSQKTFEKSISSQEKPKGFSQTVERMRRGIIENMKKRYLVKKIPVGENYEKIKRSIIKPFNITDLKKKEEIEERENYEDNSDDYFSIQVTIPSGKERTLRVHKDDDPYEIADNFCKVYGMKDEIKQRLAKTILQFMNLYLIKANEKSQNYEQINMSDNPPINNFSQNNLNLDDL